MAGSLPGQPRLSDGQWLDAALESKFALVCADQVVVSGLLPEDHARLRALGVQWLIDPALAPWLHQLDAALMILRPDRYVFGCANTAEELRQLIAKFSTVTCAFHCAPIGMPEPAPNRQDDQFSSTPEGDTR